MGKHEQEIPQVVRDEMEIIARERRKFLRLYWVSGWHGFFTIAGCTLDLNQFYKN